MVSRSSAAGNSSMPPTANIVSGKTSVCVTPVAVRTRSCSEPGHRRAGGGEGAATVEGPLGHRQDPRDREQQDGALQEQRRTVDGDRAARRRAPWSPASRDDRDEGGDEAAEREHELHGVPAGAAQNASTRTPATATPNTISIGSTERYSIGRRLELGRELSSRVHLAATPSSGDDRGRVGLADLDHGAFDRRVDDVEQHLGIDAEHDDDGQHRGDDPGLAQR